MSKINKIPTIDSLQYMFFDYILTIEEYEEREKKKIDGLTAIIANGPHTKEYLETSLKALDSIINPKKEEEDIVDELNDSANLLGNI